MTCHENKGDYRLESLSLNVIKSVSRHKQTLVHLAVHSYSSSVSVSVSDADTDEMDLSECISQVVSLFVSQYIV